MTCATRPGISQALGKLRRPEAKEMLEAMGEKIDWAVPTSIEEGTIRALQTVFASHRIQCQKWIGVYRVDVLFPDYGLIIEIDENGHQDRNQINEIQREGFLGSQYTVIRYDPHSEPVESLYREIHDHILSHR